MDGMGIVTAHVWIPLDPQRCPCRFLMGKISTSPRLIPVAFLGLARFTFWGPSPVVDGWMDGWIPCHGWMDGSAGKKGLVISGF